MVAEQSYVPQQSTMVHTLAEHLTSLPRRDQDDKHWIQNITPVPESSVLGKRDMNS